MTQPHPGHGVRIVGTGSALPERIMTNQDFEKILDTSDEWIQQRTGIKQRHISDQSKGEGVLPLEDGTRLGQARDRSHRDRS